MPQKTTIVTDIALRLPSGGGTRCGDKLKSGTGTQIKTCTIVQARGEALNKTEIKGVKTHSCIREAFGELGEQAGHGVGR